MLLPIHNQFIFMSYKKILIIVVLALVMNLGFFGYLMPQIIRTVMKMQLRVTPGTMSRKMFEKVPFPLNFNLYIFNVTNTDEVLAGEKPILQEIGPYYFEEYKDKVNIVDNKEEDTMEYDFRNTYQYKPERNGPGLTGNEFVTVAHPFLLSTIMLIKLERPQLLDFIHRALNGILHDPQDIFFTGRLWDFLYDGVPLDCSSDGIEVIGACSEFENGVAAEVGPFNETTFKFAMFGTMNGSSIGRYKVLRGKNNIRDLGRVVAFNGLPEMDAWYEDECNQFSGTDGTVFPPLHEKEEGFSIFIPQMCRIMRAEYEHPSTYAGIETNHFTIDFDITKYGSPNCYCRFGDSCPPKGITDLFPCLGTPIAISAPHFYNVDPTEAEKVIGLSPDPEKHKFYIEFYQLAGVPLQIRVRLQINVQVTPVENIPYMKRLQPMHLPVLWFDASVDLPKKYLNMLKYQLVLAEQIRVYLRWSSFVVAVWGVIVGIIACCFQNGNEKNNNLRRISTKPDTNESVNNPTELAVEIISD